MQSFIQNRLNSMEFLLVLATFILVEGKVVKDGLHSIMHQTIGITGYIGSQILTLTLVYVHPLAR